MPCGNVLECKFDRYCPEKWQNFIIERYRSKERAGGPWQSLEHGAKYFAYNFTKNNQLHLFETLHLVAECEKLISTLGLELQGISNGSYTTRFYRIPRYLFAHLELPHNLLGVENVNSIRHGNKFP